MNNEFTEDKAWNLSVINYKEYEYHELSIADLQEVLQEEWNRPFNGMFIGQDVDSVGNLGVFFYHDMAYVGYDDFSNEQSWCSYDPEACDRPGWDEMVRLTPDDAHDFAFVRGSLIPKERAQQIVEDYLSSGEITGLYLTGRDGKPLR
jgi:hypothetical protein